MLLYSFYLHVKTFDPVVIIVFFMCKPSDCCKLTGFSFGNPVSSALYFFWNWHICLLTLFLHIYQPVLAAIIRQFLPYFAFHFMLALKFGEWVEMI